MYYFFSYHSNGVRPRAHLPIIKWENITIYQNKFKKMFCYGSPYNLEREKDIQIVINHFHKFK